MSKDSSLYRTAHILFYKYIMFRNKILVMAAYNLFVIF